MKITKKFKGMLSFALTAMLAVGSVANATTTNQNAYPEVDQNRKGSITIHKYAMEKIPNPGTPATGLKLDSHPDGATPLENVQFNVYKVKDTNTKSVEELLNDENELVAEKVELVDTKKTNPNGEAAIGELDLGVYYVEEVLTGAVKVGVDPFLVSIPMAHPTENEWIYDVHVYPKNVIDKGIPTIDKSVTESGNKHDSANINQDILWIIEPQIPKDIATAVTYKVVDKLDEKLSYKKFGTVSFINKYGKPVELVKGQDYLLTEPTETKGGKLTIEFTAAGKQLLATALVDGQPLPKVQISFTTVINEDANLGEPIYNNANLVYTNTFNDIIAIDPTTPEEELPPTVDPENPPVIDVPTSGNDKPEVHTGGVLLEKVDAADSTIKLEGAKFKIYPSLVDAEAGTNAIMEVTTGEDGRAIFAGLSYGAKGNTDKEGSTKYYIVETVAPKYDSNGDGQITDADESYNILSKPFEVTVSAESHLESNKIVVANSKFKLPVTGGVGTVIFTLGGLAIMGAAAFLYMRTTRRA